MRRLYLSLALLLATGLIAAGCGDDEEETQTLEFVSIPDPQAEQDVDVGERGESAGDQFVSTEKLQEDGQPVGSTRILCTLTGTEREPTALCNATLELEEGSIAFQGAVDFREEGFDLPVIGGTGEFAGASGTASVDVSEEKETPITVEIATEDGED